MKTKKEIVEQIEALKKEGEHAMGTVIEELETLVTARMNSYDRHVLFSAVRYMYTAQTSWYRKNGYSNHNKIRDCYIRIDESGILDDVSLWIASEVRK